MHRTITQSEALKILKSIFKLSNGAIDALDRLVTNYQAGEDMNIYTTQRDLLNLLNVQSFTTVARRMNELMDNGLITYETDKKGTILNLARCKELASSYVEIELTLKPAGKVNQYIDGLPKEASENAYTTHMTIQRKGISITGGPSTQDNEEPTPIATKVPSDLEDNLYVISIPVRSTPDSDIIENPPGVFSYL